MTRILGILWALIGACVMGNGGLFGDSPDWARCQVSVTLFVLAELYLQRALMEDKK